jgi:hypothetical protein
MPYFMTNCGGTLGGTMEFASVSRRKIEEFIDVHIGGSIAWLLDNAARKGISPLEIVMPFVLKRLENTKLKAASPTAVSRLFSSGLSLYRRGFIPGPLAAALAPDYFKKIFLNSGMET